MADIIRTPGFFHRNREVLQVPSLLSVNGMLENQWDATSVKAAGGAHACGPSSRMTLIELVLSESAGRLF